LSRCFDFLVIGGGSGGVRAARRAASLGKKVALFERDRMGGTCVLKGCIPKKLMVYASSFLNQVQLAQDYGWKIDPPQMDWNLQNQRREKELSRLSSIYQNLLEESGVSIIYGEASLTSKKGVVRCENQEYQAPSILIAVGSSPYKPPFEGAEKTLVSDDMFKLKEIPQSLIVVGSGYIGLEFASIFNSLGSKVSLMFRKPYILSGFDQDIRKFLQTQLKIKGIEIISEFEPLKIQKDKNELKVFNSKNKSFSAEKILLATGRKPDLQNLNLKEAGVRVTPYGNIEVSSTFETSVSGVYAIGDCAHTSHQLTPVALAEAEVLVKHLFKSEKSKINYDLIPSAVFSQPALATVGLTEDQAVSKGIKVNVFETQFRHLKHTLSPQKTEEKVYIKMIVNQKTNLILGCHAICDEAPEIIQSVAVAMTAGATKRDFDQTIGIHPSVGEELCTLREAR